MICWNALARADLGLRRQLMRTTREWIESDRDQSFLLRRARLDRLVVAVAFAVAAVFFARQAEEQRASPRNSAVSLKNSAALLTNSATSLKNSELLPKNSSVLLRPVNWRQRRQSAWNWIRNAAYYWPRRQSRVLFWRTVLSRPK